jgi:hypothetical protein
MLKQNDVETIRRIVSEELARSKEARLPDPADAAAIEAQREAAKAVKHGRRPCLVSSRFRDFFVIRSWLGTLLDDDSRAKMFRDISAGLVEAGVRELAGAYEEKAKNLYRFARSLRLDYEP